MSDTTNGGNGAVQSGAPQPDPEFKVQAPTEGEVTAVAKAMDVDGRLDWESPDHDKVVECANAKEEARHLIVGVQAVKALMSGELEVVEPVEEQPEPEPLAPAEGEPETGDLDPDAPPYVPPPNPQAATATS
jgi:hypothetical protein